MRREVATYIALRSEYPMPRIASAGSAATRAGSSRGNARCASPGAAAATKRRQIASAALTEICWPVIARASAVNASLRRFRLAPG